MKKSQKEDEQDWSYGKVLRVQFAILTFLFGIAYALFGFNLENYEAGCTTAIQGIFTGGVPFLGFADLAHVFTIKVYAWLETRFVGWHSYSLIMLVGQFVSIQVLMFFTWLLLRPIMGSPWRTLVVQIGIFIMVDFDNIVNINLTRIAFFASGSGILALVYLSKIYPNQRILSLVAGCLLFTYGMLTRLEPAILITVYLGLVFVVLNYNLKSTWLKLAIPVILLALLELLIWQKSDSSSLAVKTIDNSFYYDVHSKRNLKPLPIGASTYDSLMYDAALSWTIGDTAHINYAYFANHVVAGKGLWWEKLLHLEMDVPGLWGYLTKYRAALLLILLANLILLFQPACRGLLRWRLLALNALFWLTVVFVSALFKTEYRLLSPMIYFYLHALIIYAAYYQILPLVFWHKKSLALVVVIAGLSVLFITEAIADSRHYQAEQRQREKIMAELKTLATDKYLVLDGYSVDIITSTVAFTPRLNLPVKAIMLYDFGPLWLLPHYSQYLQGIAQRPAEWGAMFDFLYENRAQVLYVTSPERAIFINRYLQVVHGKKYGLKAINGSFELDAWTNFGSTLQYFTIVSNESLQ